MNGSGASGPRAGRTLVCFALQTEAAAFQKRLAASLQRRTGRAADIRILLTGVGRRNARAALLKCFEHGPPARVLSCGFAGALDPALPIGAVGFTSSQPELETALRRAGAQPMRFVTVDQVAISREQKAALRQQTGADAAEMESEAIEALCRNRGVAFAVVRAISDCAGEDLPLDFNRVLRPEGGLDVGRLLVALARRPAAVPGLWRLARQARLASERLAVVLANALDLRS